MDTSAMVVGVVNSERMMWHVMHISGIAGLSKGASGSLKCTTGSGRVRVLTWLSTCTSVVCAMAVFSAGLQGFSNQG